MKVECAVCHRKLGEKPGPPNSTSHGYCRRHELEQLVKLHLATRMEIKELEAMRNL